MPTTTVARLRVGQRFSWIPPDWYGPAKLLYKAKRTTYELPATAPGTAVQMIAVELFDLKYDCACVNPPGVSYGVPASTRVRLLRPLKRQRVKRP